jgi:hypothetical protein
MIDKRPITIHLSDIDSLSPTASSILFLLPFRFSGKGDNSPPRHPEMATGRIDDPSSSDHGKKKHPEHDENFSPMGSVKIKWQDPIFR